MYGHVGHLLRDCDDPLVNKVELEYGVWLKAHNALGSKKPSSHRSSDASDNDSSSSQATSNLNKHPIVSRAVEDQLDQATLPPQIIVESSNASHIPPRMAMSKEKADDMMAVIASQLTSPQLRVFLRLGRGGFREIL